MQILTHSTYFNVVFIAESYKGFVKRLFTVNHTQGNDIRAFGLLVNSNYNLFVVGEMVSLLVLVQSFEVRVLDNEFKFLYNVFIRSN